MMSSPMFRPAIGGRGSWQRRVAGCGLLCTLCTLLWCWEDESFVIGMPERPAGNYMIVDELPRGLTCMAASERAEWNPNVEWQGERMYRPTANVQADSRRQWYTVDVDGKVLGRAASQIVSLLLGKSSPLYSPDSDVGAYVVVTNCEKIRVAGRKYHYKLYMRNLSRRPGHLKIERFKDILARFPERILMRAVWGMMPKTAQSKRIFKERLKLFTGPNHNYYQEDPVEFPAHQLKDCTRATNIKKRHRVSYLLTEGYSQKVARQEAKEAKEAEELLEKYKSYLVDYAETLSEEELANLDMEELNKQAQEDRVMKVLQANEGKPVPPKKKKTYPGTTIPIKKIQANWGIP